MIAQLICVTAQLSGAGPVFISMLHVPQLGPIPFLGQSESAMVSNRLSPEIRQTRSRILAVRQDSETSRCEAGSAWPYR